MKYQFLIVMVLLFSIQSSWGIDQKEKKNDEKAQLMPPNPAEGVVYALPRTMLNIKVRLKKETFRSGPYAQYADKYLGYQGSRMTNSETWKIVAIEVTGQGEADPEAVYKTFGPSATLVSLYSDGAIAGVNLDGNTEPYHVTGSDNISYSELPSIVFPDQGSDDQYDMEIIQETGEERMKVKSFEDRAREAADFLIRLRKKRSYTILSPSDIVPEDGKGYEVFVQQADKLEKEYLSLFLGKTFITEHEYAFSFVPGSESVKNELLFRFSEEKGLLPKSDISGKPITIEIIKDQKYYSSVENIYQANGVNSGRSGLFYRIPVNASVAISEGYNTLYSGRMPIAQYGFVSPVPELLINENTSIAFDRITGTIRHLEKKK